MEQFKRAQVVMLPAKKMMDAYKTSITKVYEDEGKLYLNKKERGELITEIGSPQHLYITSNDEIKEGDWYFDGIDFIHQKSKHNAALVDGNKQNKKIIATTNTSLKLYETATDYKVIMGSCKILPQPSQQFIEKYIESYNKGEIITDALVEYEMRHTGWTEDQSEYTYDEFIKVNPKDNTITIKRLKESWNRKELSEKLHKLKQDVINKYHAQITNLDVDEWIEENL